MFINSEPYPRTGDDGSQYTVTPYIVEDERFPGYEKFFNVSSSQVSDKIDKLLEEGHRRLMVEKERSGATGLTAMELGRDFIGIYISKEFCEQACQRLDKNFNQDRLF